MLTFHSISSSLQFVLPCVRVYVHIIIEHIRSNRDKGILACVLSHSMLLIEYIFRIQSRKLHKYDKWLSSPHFAVSFHSYDCTLLLSCDYFSFCRFRCGHNNKSTNDSVYFLFVSKINGGNSFANWPKSELPCDT